MTLWMVAGPAVCFQTFEFLLRRQYRLPKLLALAVLWAGNTYAQAFEPFDIQAHRGGLGLHTESTLTAFAHALDLGVSTLELDIQITADRQAVITHDRQVQAHKCRDTEPLHSYDPDFPYVGKYVKELSLAQLRTLDCAYQQLPGYPEQTVTKGEKMPLLSELFVLVNSRQADHVTLNIEAKVEAGAPDETAPRQLFIEVLLEEIALADLAGQVTIQSFDWGTLMDFTARAPGIPIIALTNGQSFLQCGKPGRSPWLGGLDIDDFACDPVAAAASFGAAALSPVHGDPQDGRVDEAGYVPFVTPEMVARAHARGMKIIPWTVDDRATMAYLIDMGVDGMISNYPDRLREVLIAKGMIVPPPAN